MFVHFFFRYQSSGYGFRQFLISISVSTFHICTCHSSFDGCMYGIGGTFVGSPEVGNGSTIGDYEIFESPLITEYLLKQTGVSTTRIIVQALVGTHHFAYIGFLYQCLERRQVSFPQVAGTDVVQIGGMTAPFRTAVYGIMFGTCK